VPVEAQYKHRLPIISGKAIILPVKLLRQDYSPALPFSDTFLFLLIPDKHPETKLLLRYNPPSGFSVQPYFSYLIENHFAWRAHCHAPLQLFWLRPFCVAGGSKKTRPYSLYRQTALF
jgi:hypothetical protein